MQFMITFNHVEGVWERLSPEEREAHGKRLARFVGELSAEKDARLVFLTPAGAERLRWRPSLLGALCVAVLAMAAFYRMMSAGYQEFLYRFF